MSGSTELRQQVERLLDEVIDPCSAGIGRPAGLVSMGLVKALDLEDLPEGGTRIRLLLRLTSPCCMMAPHFASQADARLRALPGVEAVEISVSPTIDWEPSHMDPDYRASLPRPDFMQPF
ncbi:metal-sulfur cluster assembly factor [Marinibaculum pumilum]|uniref:Metal-sulfur cluster assembly factor n=1 Tax=Marinibaculum pumilum TaxID=1766165 RepID=A0ABV7KZ53_9PROT